MIDIKTIINSYKIYIFIGIFFIFLASFAFMQFKINKYEKDLLKANLEYTKLLNQCTQTAIEYTDDLKKFNEKAKEVSKETITKIKYIKSYKGDNNATNCNNANKLINSFEF